MGQARPVVRPVRELGARVDGQVRVWFTLKERKKNAEIRIVLIIAVRSMIEKDR